MEERYRITYKQLTFGVRVQDDHVIDVAPCAKWMLGKHKGILAYWRARGGYSSVEKLRVV